MQFHFKGRICKKEGKSTLVRVKGRKKKKQFYIGKRKMIDETRTGEGKKVSEYQREYQRE